MSAFLCHRCKSAKECHDKDVEIMRAVWARQPPVNSRLMRVIAKTSTHIPELSLFGGGRS